MGLINLDYSLLKVQAKFKHLALTKSEFERFNTSLLGLGDISREGKHMDALAAIFDLEGFTSFCNQMDPQLVVPEYLDQMLQWLFFRISRDFVREQKDDVFILWGKFPFFAKFLGDGIIFLWDTQGLGQASLGNIVVNLNKACSAYAAEFLPRISKNFSKVPTRLRCGIARGEVIAIGGGRDFVGSCINLASRLQKLGQLSFAFAKKGFNLEEGFSTAWQAEFVVKRSVIRGLEQDELIVVHKKEFMALPDVEKALFKDP
ncbi:MAG: hypothetical protein C0404_04920 [Verrucomicrobia bacterium]|nr:hypothetical protein [Verrucomicrobiota bacterium]